MPNVKVASSAASTSKEWASNARTVAELKDECRARSLPVDNVDITIKYNGQSFIATPETQLPNEDYKAYLLPTKNKAGSLTRSEAQGVADSLVDVILRASAKADETKIAELKASLIGTVEDVFEVSLDDLEDPDVLEAQRLEASRG